MCVCVSSSSSSRNCLYLPPQPYRMVGLISRAIGEIRIEAMLRRYSHTTTTTRRRHRRRHRAVTA